MHLAFPFLGLMFGSMRKILETPHIHNTRISQCQCTADNRMCLLITPPSNCILRIDKTHARYLWPIGLLQLLPEVPEPPTWVYLQLVVCLKSPLYIWNLLHDCESYTGADCKRTFSPAQIQVDLAFAGMWSTGSKLQRTFRLQRRVMQSLSSWIMLSNSSVDDFLRREKLWLSSSEVGRFTE